MNVKKIKVIHNDHDVPHKLIYEALKRIESEEKSGTHIVEFNRQIGFNDLVEVNENDEFFEKVRGDRPYPSRFVKNKFPKPCTKLVVVWKLISDEIFKIITAYFTDNDNPCCPDEPGNILRKMEKGEKYTQQQLEEAFEFWSKHAFAEPIPRFFL